MDFSKIFNFLGKAVKNAAQDYIEEYTDGVVSVNTTSDSVNSYEIPAEYSSFPVYPGTMYTKPITTDTDKYTRISLFYKGAPSKKYYETLIEAGYSKYSDVRYDQGNTYIIIEKIGRNTKVAYHVNK